MDKINDQHFRSEDPGWDEYAKKSIWKKPSTESLERVLPAYLGQPVAALCPRYLYRGTVKSSNSGVLVLNPAYCVEIGGEFTAKNAQAEDFIPGDLLIPLAAIEILCQPAWAWTKPAMPASRNRRTAKTLGEALEDMGACRESIKWVGNMDLETAWEKCEQAQWVAWFCSKRLSGAYVDIVDKPGEKPYKDRIKDMGACQEFVDWAGDRGFSAIWKECPDPTWIGRMRGKKMEALTRISSYPVKIEKLIDCPEWKDRDDASSFGKSAKGADDAVSSYMGQAVAVLCPKWFYRGVVKNVGGGVLTLFPAFAVSISGAATSTIPLEECSVSGDVFIPLAAMEMLCQPPWASYGIGKKEK